ncbi:MAG: regulatory protein GemA [Cyanobacteriota bacterium]
MTINPKQVTLIKTIIGKLKISDDLYTEMLGNRYKVDSCKDLTQAQAKEFITFLKIQANESGLNFPQKSFNKFKHNNLSDRNGMASPKQLRKIEAMWLDYTGDPDELSRIKRLNAFLDKRFGITNIKFLPISKASKVIYCLQKMIDGKFTKSCQKSCNCV